MRWSTLGWLWVLACPSIDDVIVAASASDSLPQYSQTSQYPQTSTIGQTYQFSTIHPTDSPSVVATSNSGSEPAGSNAKPSTAFVALTLNQGSYAPVSTGYSVSHNPSVPTSPSATDGTSKPTTSAVDLIAAALQKVDEAKQQIADLERYPDSQEVQEAVKTAIDDAETAAKIAGLSWLLSVLGPATTTAEAIIAGTATVGELLKDWSAVETAVEAHRNPSASISQAPQTSASSNPSAASSKPAASAVCTINYPAADENEEDSDAVQAKRRRRQTLESRRSTEFRFRELLQKRGKGVTQIGSCTLPVKVEIPDYLAPSAFEIQLGPASKRRTETLGSQIIDLYNGIPKWFVANRQCVNTTPGFTLEKKDWNAIPPGSEQSMDHVWEIAILTRFLENQLKTSTFSCDDLNTVFFPTTKTKSGNLCQQNKLQTVFNQLPAMWLSKKILNPGFVGMERSVNSVKGYVFAQDLGKSAAYLKHRDSDFDSRLGVLQDAAMLFDIFRISEVNQLFDVTNERMYQVFIGVDNLITNNAIKRSDGSAITANWADSFKTWMESYLSAINGDVWPWAEALLAKIKNELDTATNYSEAEKAEREQKIKWLEESDSWGEDKMKFSWSLSWTAGNGIALRSLLQGRQDGSDECPVDAVPKMKPDPGVALPFHFPGFPLR